MLDLLQAQKNECARLNFLSIAIATINIFIQAVFPFWALGHVGHYEVAAAAGAAYLGNCLLVYLLGILLGATAITLHFMAKRRAVLLQISQPNILIFIMGLSTMVILPICLSIVLNH